MTTTTDPVCGKQFESRQSVAETGHDLHTFFSCSKECRSQFRGQPRTVQRKALTSSLRELRWVDQSG